MNNKKIRKLWNKTESLQNDISNLQDKENQIDKERKIIPTNSIKKIYTLDSGEITPLLFPQYRIERFNTSPIGLISGLFTGDIGVNAWDAILPNITWTDSLALYNEPLIQEPVSGQWYISGVHNIDESLNRNASASIDSLEKNKYVVGNSGGTGYCKIQNLYPPPNGWYPYGIYNYISAYYIKTPPIGFTIRGIFPKRRPQVTENKIFTYDLSCIGTKSIIEVQYSPYNESYYIVSHYEKLPWALISVRLTSKQLGELGIPTYKNIYVQIDDITTGIDGTFTIDLWNLWVKNNPEKYIYSMEVSLGIDVNGIAGGGSFGQLPTIGYQIPGSITLTKWDNIGLINI